MQVQLDGGEGQQTVRVSLPQNLGHGETIAVVQVMGDNAGAGGTG